MANLHNFDVPQRLLSLLTKAAGVFVLLAVFILEYILNLNFPCFCRPAWDSTQPIGLHGLLYMLCPPIIITSVIMLVDKMYQKTFCRKRCSGCCRKCNCCNCFCSLTKIGITFLSVVLYWIAAVFIDGEWYVCYKTNNHPKQVGIPCKKTENLTYDERLVITDYKTDSVALQ
ncbi:hypothetical protein J4Q44_G00196540 [Coregonus suidteri]|uniref:Uncharacterized protein n=1 Tax=Coregonus suidteri TaxID=861788 RepID=A0AAN8LFP6_9TELE